MFRIRNALHPVFIVIVLTVISGCSWIGSISTTGAVQVAITGTDTPSRSINPDTSTVPDHYLVQGTSDAGEVFQQTSAVPRLTITGLTAGYWNVTVDAFNDQDVHLLTGAERCLIQGGRAYFAVVDLLPATGDGSLLLDVTWPAATLSSPSVDASLVPTTGDILALDFATNLSSAAFTSDQIPGGLHTLILRVLDQGALAAGAVELVRVIPGQSTQGAFTFDEVNVPGSLEIGVEVAPGFTEDLTVSLSGGEVTVPFGGTAPITGTVAGTPANIVFAWYINGAVADAGVDTITVPTDVPGYYRVDLIATSADGTQGGSATTWVRVQEPGV